MGLKRIDSRGQMRVVEALLACVVIVLGFTISAHFSNSYLGVRRGEMEDIGINVAGLLGSQSLLEKVLENSTGTWEQDLKSCLESLLPVDTYYELTIKSTLQDKYIANISNIPGESLTADMNTASAQRVITVTLPMAKNETKELDVMLILDRSGSMSEGATGPSDPNKKIYYLKNASKHFVNLLNTSITKVGVTSFSTEASLDEHLTNNSTAVLEAIDSLTPNGYTNIGDAIKLTIDEFVQNGRGDSSWAAVLISDGEANRPYNETYAKWYAEQQAESLSGLGVAIYTIGLGNGTMNFDQTLLKQIQTDGYYYAPSAEVLDEIYELILLDILYHAKFDILVLELTVMRPGTFD